MAELEFFQMIGKESVALIAIALVYVLFVKPKDIHIKDLMDMNRQVIAENSEQLANISDTMEKISTELMNINNTQHKLKDGQDELWKEIILIKKER